MKYKMFDYVIMDQIEDSNNNNKTLLISNLIGDYTRICLVDLNCFQRHFPVFMLNSAIFGKFGATKEL